jgi:hypothetical protein
MAEFGAFRDSETNAWRVPMENHRSQKDFLSGLTQSN